MRETREAREKADKERRIAEIKEAVRPLFDDVEGRQVQRHDENRVTLTGITERLAVTESRVNDLWERRSNARRDDPDRRTS